MCGENGHSSEDCTDEENYPVCEKWITNLFYVMITQFCEIIMHKPEAPLYMNGKSKTKTPSDSILNNLIVIDDEDG